MTPWGVTRHGATLVARQSRFRVPWV
jgi:hypothetical protein